MFHDESDKKSHNYRISIALCWLPDDVRIINWNFLWVIEQIHFNKTVILIYTDFLTLI